MADLLITPFRHFISARVIVTKSNFLSDDLSISAQTPFFTAWTADLLRSSSPEIASAEMTFRHRQLRLRLELVHLHKIFCFFFCVFGFPGKEFCAPLMIPLVITLLSSV